MKIKTLLSLTPINSIKTRYFTRSPRSPPINHPPLCDVQATTWRDGIGKGTIHVFSTFGPSTDSYSQLLLTLELWNGHVSSVTAATPTLAFSR